MAATWLAFAILLVAALAVASASEWQPLPKGDAMKVLLAAMAVLLAFAAVSTYAG